MSKPKSRLHRRLGDIDRYRRRHKLPLLIAAVALFAIILLMKRILW